MEENKYDNEQFFKAYSRFPRSVEGLSAAGEWHELQKLLPDFTGKRVLDIGCGFGWHCIYAAENGASHVLGIDISKKMLAVAKEKKQNPKIEYQCIAIENIDFPPDSFDVIISSLALHYVSNFEQVCQNINRCLVSNGDFVFSVEHPVFTAHGTQDWIYDENKCPLHWPVDRYFSEGLRTANFLGEKVTKYHKTLTTYLNTLLKNEFVITNIIEPQPLPDLLISVPEMKNEVRRPMMMLVSAKKRDAYL